MRSQLREVSDVTGDKKKGSSQQPDCFYWWFKGGGRGEMPNPSKDRGAETLKSRRYCDLVIDEAVSFDQQGTTIKDELLGRATEATFNAKHPVLANHVKFLAHAEPEYDPFTTRVRGIQRRWKSGDPNACALTWCYKDWSQRRMRSGKTFRDEFGRPVETQLTNAGEAEKPSAKAKGNFFGLIDAGGAGYFSGDAMQAAVARGRSLGLTACLSVNHVRECLEKAKRQETVTEGMETTK
jgi:hypothetical protein